MWIRQLRGCAPRGQRELCRDAAELDQPGSIASHRQPTRGQRTGRSTATLRGFRRRLPVSTLIQRSVANDALLAAVSRRQATDCRPPSTDAATAPAVRPAQLPSVRLVVAIDQGAAGFGARTAVTDWYRSGSNPAATAASLGHQTAPP